LGHSAGMDIDYKTILGIIAAAMTIWAHIPYLLQTIAGTNKPHVFTWVIWTVLTGIAACAQWAGGAGAGSWVTFFTAAMCVAILLATLRNGEKHITRSDWFMFLAGLTAIPAWMLTDDPVWSVWIITLIDLAAIYPTFRKSWLKPHEENSFMYGLNIPRHMIGLMAIQHYSVTTTLYPAALVLMNVGMYAMLKWRRKNLTRANEEAGVKAEMQKAPEPKT